jgi:hypothetical protein
MELIESKIFEINRLHGLAQVSASDAVEYAKQAGLLLVEVKNKLKHGQFLSWINDNLSVSVRQAQRYMDVANGKPVAIRSLAGKYDTMSHLEKLFGKSLFIPESGHKYETVVWTSETDALWVLIDPFKPLEDNNFLIRCYTLKEDGFDKSIVLDQTMRPIPALLVYTFLQSFGLEEPQLAHWNKSPSEGFNKPSRSWDEKGNTILKCEWEEVE